jgi:hypothetical protein
MKGKRADPPSLGEELGMPAVIRRYSGEGAKEPFQLLEERKTDVENAIGAVAGLKSYSLIRTDDGGVSVTVCADKNGDDERVRVAREWVQKNAASLALPPARPRYPKAQ